MDHAHRKYRDVRRAVLRHSQTCWICGHDQADTTDHIHTIATGGSWLDPANLRPAHGVLGCPTCGRKCNSERGDGSKGTSKGPSEDWYA